MKPYRLFCSMLVVMMLWAPALADEFGDGLHGMKWASPISEHPDLVKIHETNSVAYYVDAETIYQVGDVQVDRVVYGFYKGKLFAGFLNLSTPLQMVNLKRHFETRYGPPVISYNAGHDLTVYRWKTDRIKIKLKIRKGQKNVKMAIYFTPLSKEINEEAAEKSF
jgi:hypothetical protein